MGGFRRGREWCYLEPLAPTLHPWLGQTRPGSGDSSSCFLDHVRIGFLDPLEEIHDLPFTYNKELENFKVPL